MTDITSPRLLYLKGGLFGLGGVLASVVLIAQTPTLKTTMLLCVAVWCFARAYYFAFYVVQHYIDDSFRFSGLWSFIMYVSSSRKRGGRVNSTADMDNPPRLDGPPQSS